jgi:hypothetical protein
MLHSLRSKVRVLSFADNV